MKPASLIAAIVLDLVAVLHAVRLVLHTEVTIGGWVAPMWISGVGFVAAATLSVFLVLESRSKSS